MCEGVCVCVYVLRHAARKQDHNEVERYGAGYLYWSTAEEKPDVTVLAKLL